MASFGETLKRERELREISLREVSDATKINLRYLEALEQNRFEVLPGGLFNRGFIRAFAAYIGLDGEALVNSYLEEIAPKETAEDDLNEEIPFGVHRPTRAPRRRAAIHEPTAYGVASQPGPAPSATPPWEAPNTNPPPLDGSSLRLESVDEEHPSEGPRRAPNVLFGVLAAVVITGIVFVALSLFLPHTSGPVDVERGTGAAALFPDRPVTEAAGGPGDPAMAGTQAIDETGDQLIAGVAGGGVTGEPTEAADAPTGSDSATSSGSGNERSADSTSRDPVPSPSGPMNLRVETSERTWVQLFCDSREEINWVMRAGETRDLQCMDSIRVSAKDAAAVHLAVNGAPCLPLGERDTRVYGYTIRIEDFTSICRSSRRRPDARR